MEYRPSKPIANPTSKDCRDALAKGLGRAHIWVDSNVLDREQLVFACVNDLRYDMQCEDSRCDWLWMLVQACGYTSDCEWAVWKALLDLGNERNATQVCELAMKFALAGKKSFKERLIEIVREKGNDDDLTLGEKELLRVAGIDGFCLAAAKRGVRLRDAKWEWDDADLIRQAIQQFGESQVRASLDSNQNADVQRFRKEWIAQSLASDEDGQRGGQRQPKYSIPIDALIAAAQSKDRCFWFRRWGINASEKDIKVILDQITESTDPELQSRLLKVFMRRKLPWIPDELFDYCRSSHDELALFASRALEGNSSPAIRSFALERLESGFLSQAIDQLVGNFEPGDETLIEQAMVIPEGSNERHGLMMSCRSILEANETANADPLAFMIYDFTPCSICRTAAVGLLKRQSRVPGWMVNELRFDCDFKARILFYPQPTPFE